MVAFFLFGVALHTELAAMAHVDSLGSRRSDEMENEIHHWIIANGGWFPPSFTGELFSLLVVLYCSWSEANEAVLHMGFTWLELGWKTAAQLVSQVAFAPAGLAGYLPCSFFKMGTVLLLPKPFLVRNEIYILYYLLVFSSPVRRTESYSDTPGMSVSVGVSVSVKMLKFLVQVISFLMFLSTTLFLLITIYKYIYCFKIIWIRLHCNAL